MNRYDWSWDRPYDRGYRTAPMRGYGSEYARGTGWWGGGPEGYRGRNPGMGRGRAPRRMGYDRGTYGEAYPTYGGYPGDDYRGMYYGGQPYDASYEPRGRREMGRGGYARAREPFVPEAAYMRHPELGWRQHPMGWPGYARPELHVELGDDEIRDSVEQNLAHDDWLDAGRIQVDVSDQVVTLKGEVDDYLEARYAWDDAWEAGGVRGVVNQLTVRVDEPHETHGDILPQSEGRKKAK